MTTHVHGTAVLEGAVELDDGVQVGAFSFIKGPVVIGARTRISPHCVVGTDGEHKRLGPSGIVRIGADVTIREFSIVHRGTGDRDTSIGDRAYLMRSTHVSHDTVIDEDVTISPNVTLGGHSRIHRYATLGIGVCTHQLSTIGAGAFCGMGAVVTKDVPPFALVIGNPARFVRVNERALDAAGITGPLADSPIFAAAVARFRADLRGRPVMELRRP